MAINQSGLTYKLHHSIIGYICEVRFHIWYKNRNLFSLFEEDIKVFAIPRSCTSLIEDKSMVITRQYFSM